MSASLQGSLDRGVAEGDANAAERDHHPSITSQIVVRGSMNATADATWDKTMQNLSGPRRRHAARQSPAGTRRNYHSVDGVIHTRYMPERADNCLSTRAISELRRTLDHDSTAPSATMRLCRFVSTATICTSLKPLPPHFGRPGSTPVGIYGRATLNATVSGSTRSPQISGQLTGDNLRVRGSAWKTSAGQLRGQPIANSRGERRARLRQPGACHLQAGTALQAMVTDQVNSVPGQIAASQINVADLLKASGSTRQSTGTLRPTSPPAARSLSPAGHGTIGLASARIAGEPIRAVDLQFRDRQSGECESQDRSARRSANATLRYEPATQAYSAELHAPGIKLDQLETLKARNLEIQGVLDMNATGRGTLQDPQMQAVLKCRSCRFAIK